MTVQNGQAKASALLKLVWSREVQKFDAFVYCMEQAVLRW
jgi:hypothetical protein